MEFDFVAAVDRRQRRDRRRRELPRQLIAVAEDADLLGDTAAGRVAEERGWIAAGWPGRRFGDAVERFLRGLPFTIVSRRGGHAPDRRRRVDHRRRGVEAFQRRRQPVVVLGANADVDEGRQRRRVHAEPCDRIAFPRRRHVVDRLEEGGLIELVEAEAHHPDLGGVGAAAAAEGRRELRRGALGDGIGIPDQTRRQVDDQVLGPGVGRLVAVGVGFARRVRGDREGRGQVGVRACLGARQRGAGGGNRVVAVISPGRCRGRRKSDADQNAGERSPVALRGDHLPPPL